MLRHVLFDLSLFMDESDRANSQKRVLWLLEALTRCNQLYLQQHPETPLIYQSGIEYKVPQQFERADLPEADAVQDFLAKSNPPQSVVKAFKTLVSMCGGGEHFRDIPRIIENGGGDCDNVASWRTAELRQLGIAAKPYITWRRRMDGGMTYHVVVIFPNGTHEDPSLLLGMGGEGRRDDREEELRKMGERLADVVNGDLSSTFGHGGRRETILGQTESGFGKGIQYTIPFQTDDSYEDWSPTRPQAYYADPRYPAMTPTSGPLFNTRMRDYEDYSDFDIDDKFDGDEIIVTPRFRRRLRRVLRYV